MQARAHLTKLLGLERPPPTQLPVHEAWEGVGEQLQGIGGNEAPSPDLLPPALVRVDGAQRAKCVALSQRADCVRSGETLLLPGLWMSRCVRGGGGGVNDQGSGVGSGY